MTAFRPKAARSEPSPRSRRSPGTIERIVLEQLARCNAPVSAYALADRCRDAGEPVVPNQVYRTLARLIDLGLAHRLECLSAYMHSGRPFDACLICDTCHDVQLLALPEVISMLRDHADTRCFRMTRPIVGAIGRCAECAKCNPGPRQSDSALQSYRNLSSCI